MEGGPASCTASDAGGECPVVWGQWGELGRAAGERTLVRGFPLAPSPQHAARFPLSQRPIPARHVAPTAPESAPSSHFRGTRPANLTPCSLLLRPPWVAVTASILWIPPVFLMTLRLEAPASCFQDPLQDPPVQVLCPESTQLQAARHIHRWPLVSSAPSWGHPAMLLSCQDAGKGLLSRRQVQPPPSSSSPWMTSQVSGSPHRQHLVPMCRPGPDTTTVHQNSRVWCPAPTFAKAPW